MTITDAEIEAVARALCELSGFDPGAIDGDGLPTWQRWQLDASDVLTAHRTSLRAQGMRVVPAEPTEAMLNAGLPVVMPDMSGTFDGAQRDQINRQLSGAYSVELRDSYRAMLAASEDQ